MKKFEKQFFRKYYPLYRTHPDAIQPVLQLTNQGVQMILRCYGFNKKTLFVVQIMQTEA